MCFYFSRQAKWMIIYGFSSTGSKGATNIKRAPIISTLQEMRNKWSFYGFLSTGSKARTNNKEVPCLFRNRKLQNHLNRKKKKRKKMQWFTKTTIGVCWFFFSVSPAVYSSFSKCALFHEEIMLSYHLTKQDRTVIMKFYWKYCLQGQRAHNNDNQHV